MGSPTRGIVCSQRHSGDGILLANVEVLQRLVGKGPISSLGWAKVDFFFLVFVSARHHRVTPPDHLLPEGLPVPGEKSGTPPSRDRFVLLPNMVAPWSTWRPPGPREASQLPYSSALALPTVFMGFANQRTLFINLNKLAMDFFSRDILSLVGKWNQSLGELLF